MKYPFWTGVIVTLIAQAILLTSGIQLPGMYFLIVAAGMTGLIVFWAIFGAIASEYKIVRRQEADRYETMRMRRLAAQERVETELRRPPRG